MKKKLLLSTLVLGMTLSVSAQTQRIPLFEEWTGENCGPCAGANPGITSLANANFNPKKLILLRYQVAIPSAPSNPNSLYQQNPTEPTTRQAYYYPVGADRFAPQGRMDGQELAIGTGNQGSAAALSQTEINNAYAVPSPFAMTTSYTWNAASDSITITTNITAAQAFTATSAMYLRVAICEKNITYATAPGSNGEINFEYIMRDMVPNTTGIALAGTWTNGQNFVNVQKVKVPTYIWKKTEVTVVAFIQEDKPGPGPGVRRDVHQAAYGDVAPLGLDASAFAITGLSNYTCVNSVNPVFELKNVGVNTLTSCDITHQLDGGAVGNIPWTGNLLTGQSAMVNLPTQTTAVGSHTLTINVNNVNGATDINTGNNQYVKKFQNINITPVFPLFEGFETVFPMPNWERINPDGLTAWTRTTLAKKTGVASVRMDNANYTANGAIDEFRLPPIDLSATVNPVLTFEVAYKLWTNPALNPHWSDTCEVVISTDCGVTFSSVYKKFDGTLATGTPVYQGSDFIPTSNQWRQETINLAPFNGTPNLLIKFRNINDYENNLYIDDINISDNAIGINQNNVNSGVKIFPNPAKDMVNITVNQIESENITITIYNSVGQAVYAEGKNFIAGENTLSISTGDFAAGMYSVVISSGNNTHTQKLAISK